MDRKTLTELYMNEWIPKAQAKTDYMKKAFWDLCRDFDAGKHWGKHPSLAKNKVTVNKIQETNHKILSLLYAQVPIPVVHPVIADNPDDEKNGIIPNSKKAEAINDILDQYVRMKNGITNFKEETEQAFYESFLSIGITKVIHVLKTQKVDRSQFDENGIETVTK